MGLTQADDFANMDIDQHASYYTPFLTIALSEAVAARAGLFQSPVYVTLSRFCGPSNVASARLRRVLATHNADFEKALAARDRPVDSTGVRW